MFKNHKIFPILFLLFSCKSMSNVQLYDEVGLLVDPYESFQYKNIFSDSQSTGVWGKSNSCKEISFDTLNNYIGSDHLHVAWNKKEECKWLGFGFKWGNFQSKNLKPLINSSAIQFRIRCDSGEFYKVPMFFALVDYAEKQCFSKINLLNISGGIIDQEWRKVLIPLSTFKFQKKGVNISNIKELRIQLQNKVDFHLDDIKIVRHQHNYQYAEEIFSHKFSNQPISLGTEKKYWWGVDENYSSNFKFNLSTSNDEIVKLINDNNTLPELDVSLSLLVNYNLTSSDYKWNSFGFPFNKWEMANLSDIYSTSALNFYVRGNVPKIQITLISYSGKKRRISKMINENNIRNIDEDFQMITIPFKSFKDFEYVNWSSMKELRFKILETSKFEMGDFKIVEFRGNPNKPSKWLKL